MKKKHARRSAFRVFLVFFTLAFTMTVIGLTAHAADEITPGPVTSQGSEGTETTSEPETSQQASAEPEPDSQEPEPEPEPEPSVSSRRPRPEPSVSSRRPDPEPEPDPEPDPEPTYSEPESSRSPAYDPDTDISVDPDQVESAPDTDANLINQQAEQLDSAPNANSEDWDAALAGLEGLGATTSSGTGSDNSTASTAVGGLSGSTNTNQPVSKLFIAGIVLVVAAVAGGGLFVYFQFFWRRRPGAPAADGGPRSTGPLPDGEENPDDYTTTEIARITDTRPTPPRNVPASRSVSSVRPVTDDTIDHFTDINSSSDGIQHREEYEEFVARNKPPIVPKPMSRTAPPVHAPNLTGSDEPTIPMETSNLHTDARARAQASAAARQAAQQARQRAVLLDDPEAAPPVHRRQPPLTSNALPLSAKGRPGAAWSGAARMPASKAPTAPSASKPVPQKSAKPKDDDFDWDAFLDENRKH